MLPFKTYQTNFLLLLTGFDMSWFICARKARFHAHVYVWIKVLQFFVLLKHTIDVPQINSTRLNIHGNKCQQNVI